MAPGILAGNVDVKLMMGMLDDGDAQALRVEMRDQPRQQRGLARTAPACKADDFHRNSASTHNHAFWWNHRPPPAVARSVATKQSRVPPRKDSGLLRYARNDESKHFRFPPACLYRLDPNVMLTAPPS